MRVLRIAASLVAALAVAACSDSSDEAPPEAPYTGFVRPAGTIAVNFTVDDTANMVYAPGDLKWKGSMLYNPTTRKVTVDSGWSGDNGGGPLSGWAPLMDDGPWTVTTTAHEPIGNVANDHKFGVTVFVTPPAAGTQAYEYGLIDQTYETAYGNGWIWPPGPNGTFTVAAGQTADINAPGLVIPAFGTIDLRLTVDTGALDAGSVWDTTNVGVKGSAWAWGTVNITSTASAGVYNFVLSAYTGAGKQFDHTGLLKSGQTPEFIFTFDAEDTGSTTTSCCAAGCGRTPPCEYKVSGVAATAGVTAETKPAGGAFAPRTISIAGNGNTYITVP